MEKPAKRNSFSKKKRLHRSNAKRRRTKIKAGESANLDDYHSYISKVLVKRTTLKHSDSYDTSCEVSGPNLDLIMEGARQELFKHQLKANKDKAEMHNIMLLRLIKHVEGYKNSVDELRNLVTSKRQEYQMSLLNKAQKKLEIRKLRHFRRSSILYSLHHTAPPE